MDKEFLLHGFLEVRGSASPRQRGTSPRWASPRWASPKKTRELLLVVVFV